MAYQIKGLLHHVGSIDERTLKSGKTMRTQSIVLRQPSFDQWTGEEKASNYIQLETSREDVIQDLLGLNLGDKVEADFYPNGVEYENRAGQTAWFTKLRLTGIRLIEAAAPSVTSVTGETNETAKASDDLPDFNEGVDKLPF